jgi:hypothetical protein
LVASLSAFVVPVGGCGDDDSPPSSGCADVHFATQIPVPAVNLTMPAIERIAVHTAANDAGVLVAIEDSQGTVSFDGTGPIPAFIYNKSTWSDIDRTVLHGLGVIGDTWFPFWVYCTSDGKLTEFYGERTDAPGWTGKFVDGTCASTPVVWTMSVSIPAHHLDRVAMTCGFDVTTPGGGSDVVELASSRPGEMAFPPGHDATMLVFNTADCRGGCGGTGSWFELHSIMWDPGRNEVGLIIWYLDSLTGGVRTDYSLILPSGQFLSKTFAGATWQLAY